MARIIVKSSFIRPQDPGRAEHLYNLVEYMATRPGVELVTVGWEQRPPTPHQEQLIRELIRAMPTLRDEPDYEAYQAAPSMATASRLIDTASAPIQTLAPDPQIPPEQRNDPATEKQMRLIDQLLKDFPDCRDSLEYEDYLASPTKGSASELISHAMEENMFRLGSREAYIQYLAMRPGAERAAGHGLFSSSEEPVDLHDVAATVANHPGNVWTHIVSLRREDAEKLCMASAKAWQALLRTQSAKIADAMHIPLPDLQWYAAFHNEGHHPHIHMVAYSTGKEPYMGKKDIEKLKSSLAREIFRPEMIPIYAEQTANRDALTEQSRNELTHLISAMESGSSQQPELEADLRKLAEYMGRHKGKAVYGYLPPLARELVNGIVDRLQEIPEIAGIYDRWYDQRSAIVGIYTNRQEARQPLSKNKAFRGVKNAVVQTAVELASGAVLPAPVEVPKELPLPEIPVAFPDPPYSPEPETAEDFLERHPYPGTGSLPDDIPPDDPGEPSPPAPDDRGTPGREPPPAPGDPGEPPPPAPGDPGEPPPPAPAHPGKLPLPTPGGTATPENWWSTDYKLARLYLYGTKTVQPDLPRAYAAMIALARSGNALAQCDLGRMLADGIACPKDPAAAQSWYAQALAGFTAAQESQQKKDYWQYRIGKLHAMGLGTDQDYGLAAEWYEKAVEQGNPFAAYALAGQYCRGQGVPQDDENAFGLYTIAAEHETRPNAYAMYELGRMCQNGIGTPVDPAAAQKWYTDAYQGFEKLEETVNDDKLWYRLGQMCLQGLGTERDYGKAKDYFEKAAALKNANAYYGLGRLYETPDCAFRDSQKSIDSYTKAAQLGHSYAMYRLGRIYLAGEVVPQDIPAGVGWLRQAAELDNPHAQYYLGKMYLLGDQIPTDPAEGIRLLRLASDAGIAGAKYQMARCYLAGEHVAKDIPGAIALLQGLTEDEYFAPHAAYQLGKLYLSDDCRDPEQAISYLEQAAKSGHSYAMYRLGRIYLAGEAVPQDIPAGVGWLRQAAELDNPHAQYYLGKMYLQGDQIPADPAEGIRLLRLASDAGIAGAKYQMARCCLAGEHVTKDIPGAIALLQGLMEDEYFAPHAAYLLGKLYLSDDCWDPGQAIPYLEQSAQAGNSYAEYSLGRYYLYGTGGDRELGMRYLKSAAAHGNEYAEQLIQITQQAKIHYAAQGTIRLLHHLARIFRQQADRQPKQPRIDHKLAAQIARKKQEQGQKIG